MAMKSGTPRGWTRRRNHKPNDNLSSRDFRGNWTGLYVCDTCGETLDRNGDSHFPSAPDSIPAEFRWVPKS